MFLSFISEQIEKLQEKIDKLEGLGASLEQSGDDIIEELREIMRERVYDAISEAFAEHEIEDNYYNEKEQEAIDELVQYIEQNM